MKGRIGSTLALAAALAFGAAGSNAEGDGKAGPTPAFVKLRVTHRVFPQFQDTLIVKLNERHTVGDTEYSCEVVEFYPHFAINDSTKRIVSLSDEPENPAFKIRVYEDDKQTEDTWAFYGIDIPHFGRTSYLAFQVLEFEYRGSVIGVKAVEPVRNPGGDERK